VKKRFAGDYDYADADEKTARETPFLAAKKGEVIFN
jgi:hypothetical protein